MSIPYTYFLYWTKTKCWYYGVRYAKNCKPQDLFNPYKSSSRHVKEHIKSYGEPDIIQVRKIFDCPKKAQRWETTVLRRMKVLKNVFNLNRNDNLIPPIMRGKLSPNFGKKIWTEENPNPMKGKNHSKETKERISKKLKGTSTYTDSRGNHIRANVDDSRILAGELIHVARGKKRNDQHKENYSKSKIGSLNPMHGVKPHNAVKGWDEETKKKIRASVLARPNLTCPHCFKTMDPSNAKRYHFDKCKKYVREK